VKKGEDPAAAKQARRRAANVSELCDLYLADAEAGRLLTRRKKPKKRSTLEIDKGRVERHIKPLLGRLKVTAVTSDDIANFMHDVAEGKTAGNAKSCKKRGLARVRGGKTTATRTVGLLGGIFSYAVQHRMRQDNPVHGVIRFEDGKRERRLTDDEYKSLGDALRRAKEIYNRILWEEREYGQPRDRSRITGSKEVLKRLATDQRMERVWKELYRKQRASHKFLNPVKRIFQRGFHHSERPQHRPARRVLATLHDPEQQDMGVGHFLEVAWFFAEATRLRLMTEDKHNSIIRPYTMMASRLRKDAEDLRALKLGDLAANVESAAISCEEFVGNLTSAAIQTRWLFPIVKRSRGDDVMRNYVLQMSAHCREAFDKCLPGTLATTASVALAKKIDAHQVRDIVRAHNPGVI
jgi:hypothetical protein